MKSVTSSDGTKIAYDIQGDGPLLVCIFGATCFRNFIPVKSDIKKFSKKFKVINFDRRGRGDSEDRQPWSLQKEIDDIKALIDAHGGKAILYGHSSGAVIALETALALPEQVEKVIIYDASYANDENEVKNYATLRAKVSQLLADHDYKSALRTFLKEIGMPKLFIYALPLMPGYRSMVKLAPTLAYDMELTKSTPPLERLSALGVDALLMVGAKNGNRLLSVHRQLSGALPHAEGHVIPGQDHMVNVDSLMPHVVRFSEKR